MPLTYDRLLQEAHAFLARPGENQVGAQEALAPDLAGLPLFDPPLLGISAAHDPLYATLKAPEAIGPWFLSPEEWLPGAASVLSFFFPFSQAVIQSNRQTPDAPSPAWLHGRVEGQALLFRWARHLVALLQAAGWQALFGPPVCLHGTPGHRPPVSFPGRLYQPVVRTPRRLYQRPGDLRPAQGPHHRTGNLRAVCQRPD